LFSRLEKLRCIGFPAPLFPPSCFTRWTINNNVHPIFSGGVFFWCFIPNRARPVSSQLVASAVQHVLTMLHWAPSPSPSHEILRFTIKRGSPFAPSPFHFLRFPFVSAYRPRLAWSTKNRVWNFHTPNASPKPFLKCFPGDVVRPPFPLGTPLFFFSAYCFL